MQKRKPYDLKAPGTQKRIDEIVHGAYTTEGTMVAFPLCFPGMSVPIPPDESRITALDIAADGIVYGGTSGHRAHLFYGIFHGATGMVFDMGAIDGATECAAVCCGRSQVIGCLNDMKGSRIVRRQFQGLPFDLLQEWGFERTPFDDLGPPIPGERIVHAVSDPARDEAVIATERHLVLLDIPQGKYTIVGDMIGQGRIARGSQGSIVGLDEENTLWVYAPESRVLTRRAVSLPQGNWYSAPLRWARDPVDGTLYTAEAAGRLYAFREDIGFSHVLGQAPLAPVNAMAVTFDGRLFGACGEGIGKTFCYHPAAGTVTATGVAVSVLERRRYGYVFGDAVTGRDGQIIFGENDNLGHLWLYFPRILPSGARR